MFSDFSSRFIKCDGPEINIALSIYSKFSSYLLLLRRANGFISLIASLRIDRQI
jgi:hypothetical protein